MPIGSVLGGLISQGGSQAAGGMMAGAGGQAYGNARDEAQLGRVVLSPWVTTGQSAVNELSQLYGLGRMVNTGANGFQPGGGDRAGEQQDAFGRFQTSPGYQFRQQEGVNALDRSAASRGRLLSGAQIKGVNDYGQGMASDEYGRYVGGLNALSGGGMAGAQAGNSNATSLINAGNAMQFQGNMGQASSYSQGQNALASGLQGGFNSLMSLGAYGGSGGRFGLPGWT